ncbi:hypothetical protein XENOCAPTIV_026004, partial [Xenoophorus captivus]
FHPGPVWDCGALQSELILFSPKSHLTIKDINRHQTSVIKGTYLALEHMSKEYGKIGGTIINVSSMAEVNQLEGNSFHGFAGDYGVRINVLCPAFVDTPLLLTVENEDNMGKFVKFKDDFKRSMNKFGVLHSAAGGTSLRPEEITGSPSLIAEGMMRLITDNSLNGAVMKITCSKGIHFHTYEPMSA